MVSEGLPERGRTGWRGQKRGYAYGAHETNGEATATEAGYADTAREALRCTIEKMCTMQRQARRARQTRQRLHKRQVRQTAHAWQTARTRLTRTTADGQQGGYGRVVGSCGELWGVVGELWVDQNQRGPALELQSPAKYESTESFRSSLQP